MTTKKRAARKRKATTAPALKAIIETPIPDDLPEHPEPVYSFPSRSRCPRCKGANTTATTTRNGVQYRECRSPVCRHRYSVRGEQI